MSAPCPICGKDNKCAVDSGRPAHTCWCTSKPLLSAEAAEKLAILSYGTCVCEDCYDDHIGIEEIVIEGEA